MLKLALLTPGYTPAAQKRGMGFCQHGFEVLQISELRSYQTCPQPPDIPPDLAYSLKPVPIHRVGHPHRGFLISTLAFLKGFAPDVIAVERDPDTLIALQVALARNVWASSAKLVLHSWQNVARPLKPLPRWVLNRTLRAAEGICYANQDGLGILQQWGYTGRAFYQIWHGVDTEIFHPYDAAELRKRYLATPGFLLGYVGRLVPEKGLKDMIKAVAQLPDTVHAVLIGNGPQRAELEALAETQNVTERLHFLGSIPHPELPHYFSMLDALVLPSRTTPVWKEQFGRVLIEAMACGIPCIGSNSGAIPEVIGPAGRIFPEGDTAALAACIRELHDSLDLCVALRQEARARVAEHYTVAQVTTQIAQVYKDIAHATANNA